VEIACLQLRSAASLEENIREIEVALSQPEVQRGSLVVLPEATMLAFGGRGEALVAASEGIDGFFVSQLINLADRHDVTLVAGMFETNASALPFNSTVVVTREGVVSCYRKIHLYDALGFDESSSLTPGDPSQLEQGIVEIDGWRVGVMTCFDLRFPEVARQLTLHGAQLIVMGAAWVAGPDKIEQWKTLLSARAIENGCFIAAAAQPGPRYCGSSQIVDPMGRVITSAQVGDPAVITATIDMDVIHDTRSGMPLLDLRRVTS
jgi:deaminated glutathione amidase